jgi:hypothetical protein
VAIGVGTTVSSQGDGSYAWTSLSHTVDANTDVLIVVVEGWSGSGSGMDISGAGSNYAVNGATWTKSGESGQAMTGLNPADANIYQADEVIMAFMLVNPNIGAGTISFGSGNQQPTSGVHFIALNLLNVDTTVGTNGLRGQASDTGSTNATATAAPTSAATDLVLLLVGSDDSSYGTTAGGTNHFGPSVTGGSYCGVWSYPGASPTKSVGVTTADWPAIFALSFAEDDTGGGPSGPPLAQIMTLGAGG